MDKTAEKDRMNKIIEAMMKVAIGDYSVQIELSGRNDDLDSLAMGINMMIEDIKYNTEKIKRSEKRYKTLFEDAGEGIAVVDTETKRFLYANPAICKTLGYTEDELKNMTIQDIHPEYFLASEFAAQAKGEKLSSENIPCLRKDLKVIYADIKMSNIRIDGRECNVGFFTNVTERKQAEEALKESEIRYHELFSHISSGVAIYEVKDNGKDFIFKDFNKAAEQLDGNNKDDIIGKSIYEVRPSIEKFGLLDVFRRVYTTGIPEHYPAVFYEDERLQGWYDNFVYKLPTNEIVAVFDRITERKEAEDNLRESEERFRQLFEESPSGIALTDAKGVLLEVNSKLLNMFSISKEHLIGKHFSDLTSAFGLNTEVHLDDFKKRLTGEKPMNILTFRNMNGRQMTVDVQSSVITRNGKTDNVMYIINDITERKTAEEKEKEHIRNKEILSNTAMELVSLPVEKNMYQYIGERLRDIISDSMIVIMSHEKKADRFIIRSYEVNSKNIFNAIAKLFGTDPTTISYPTTDEVKKKLYQGKLVEISKDLHEITKGTIPESLFNGFNTIFNIDKIYSMGFVRQGVLLGSATIITKKGKDIINKDTVEAFINQASIALQRKLAEEEEKKYQHDLMFLNDSAFELMKMLSREDNIYQFAAEKLKEITGESFVLINSLNNNTKEIYTEAFAGQSKLLDKGIKVLGQHPVGMSYPYVQEFHESLIKGKLFLIEGGIYECTNGKIPKTVCKRIEKLINLNKIYSIGFLKGGTMLGNAVIMTRNNGEITNHRLIETFVNQISFVLQHKLAEEKEKEYIRSMEFLSKSVSELVDLKLDEATIYELIGKNIKDFTEASFVSMSSYDINKKGLYVEDLLGVSKNMQYVIEKIVGKKWREQNLSHEGEKIMLKGKLIETTNILHELLPGKLSADKLKRLLKVLNISKLYTMGMVRNRKLLGSITLTLSKGSISKNTIETIEAFINQASIALQRAQAEKELAASEERYKTLVKTAAEGIFVADIETLKFVYANAAICKMLGYSEDELLGMEVMDIHPKEELTFVISEFEAQARGEKTLASDIPCLRKDGSIVFADINTAKVNIDGRDCNVGFFTDISQRKEIAKVRERFMNELEEKNKELEQIVYVASHDLRSPLVNIQGFSNELLNTFNELDPVIENKDIPPEVKEKLVYALKKDVPEFLNYIMTSSAKMDLLLKGLLRLSRLGRASVNIIKLNMNDLFTDIIKTYEYQIKEKNITVDLEKLPPSVGDAVMVNQIFSNLLENAIKYCDCKRSCVIKISGKQEDGSSIYCVEDNGIGIAKEHIDKIFNIFHRLDPDKTTGEGIGLTIVKKVLYRLKGNIWVESELNKGSRFFVSLPNK